MITKKLRTYSKVTAFVGFCVGFLLSRFSINGNQRSSSSRLYTQTTLNHESTSTPLLSFQKRYPSPLKIRKYCEKHFNESSEHRNHPSFKYLSRQTRSISILDIGGYHGTTSFPPILCFPVSHRVISVEPVLKNQEILMMFAERFGLSDSAYSWQMIRGAFSNVTENSVIHVPEGKTNTASLSHAAAAAYGFQVNYIKQPVQKIRGDEIFQKTNVRPDYIKIDVQGQEALVMQGMGRILSQNRNMVVFAEQSAHLIAKQHISFSAAFNLMSGFGFKAYCDANVHVRDSKFVIDSGSTELSVNDVSRGSPCGDLIFWKMGNTFKQ